MRAAIAELAESPHLAMGAGLALSASVVDLSVGASAADPAGLLALTVLARITLCAKALDASMWAAAAVPTVGPQ